MIDEIRTFTLGVKKVDLDNWLKEQEIPYFKETDGTYYFKSAYARNRAHLYMLSMFEFLDDEVMPEGLFK